MIETTKEICKKCGKEYDDHHIVPRAEYAPYYCEQCTEELNTACGGSWIGAVFAASKDKTPYDD